MSQLTKLEPEKIIDSVSILEKRISDRFPDSGLKDVCCEFLILAEQTKKTLTTSLNRIFLLRFFHT